MKAMIVIPTYDERDNIENLTEEILALDPGLVILSMGILTDFNNLGPCGQAMVQFNATIPAGIPPGTEIAVQSVSFGLSLVNLVQSAPQFSTPLLLTF